MKKILVILCVLMAFGFVYGCGGGDDSAQTSSQTTTQAVEQAETQAVDAVEDVAETVGEGIEATAGAVNEAADEAIDAVTGDDAEEVEEVEEVEETVVSDSADPFVGQAPITQADIDAYAAALPKMQAAAMKQDANAIYEIYKEAGFDEIRGAYVFSKIGTAYGISTNPSMAEMMTSQLQDSLKPTQAEIDLVAKNQDKILKAMMGQ